ncbi:MAG: polysaccharide biosynthesis/export family protein [Elusimicrobiota bacterium]
MHRLSRLALVLMISAACRSPQHLSKENPGPKPFRSSQAALVQGQTPASSAAQASQLSPEQKQAALAEESAAIAAAMQQVARSKTDYKISPADLISITVYQDLEMNRKVRVNANGAVSMPLIGAVKIGGMTLIEAQSLIESKLAKFLVSPQVSLFIEDYGNKTVFVMGEVQRPGSYPIPTESRLTVLEAISTAGGFTPIAGQDRTRVLRIVNGASVSFTIEVKAITQQGLKEKDMVLEPNDVVYVPQSFF